MRAGELGETIAVFALVISIWSARLGRCSSKCVVWKVPISEERERDALLRSFSSTAGAYRRFIEAMAAKRKGIVLRYAQRHPVGRKPASGKRKLYPLARFPLGIERGGLHAFRHTNSTLMDRLGVPLKLRQQQLSGTVIPRLH